MHNPAGLRGISFVEFASDDPEALRKLFLDFGFSKTMRHKERAVDLYEQGEIRFLLNREPRSFARGFSNAHGPSIPALGLRVENGADAVRETTSRGAKLVANKDHSFPALSGIGGSLLYLVDSDVLPEFVPLDKPERVPSKGFVAIDHLTNNVENGSMMQWVDFYKRVFGFSEVRYFDIRGVKTGLTSYALRSPCGTFAIPINEGTEKKSQINEYLEEYRGPGIQHLAFLTRDILASMRAMQGTNIAFLDMDAGYYEDVFRRVPNVKEDRTALKAHNILVDGDKDGYLLQIFTKNLCGPIFVELIQRENHMSFGEGNFGALFRSIERDQTKRGYLEA